MIGGIADTHTALWHLFGDARLSSTAKNFILAAAARGEKIAVSAISMAELVYLVEKNRLPRAAYDGLSQALRSPRNVFTEAALTAEVVEAMKQVSRSEVPDLPDRIIAATAVYFRVPVISRDGRIRSANLRSIW